MVEKPERTYTGYPIPPIKYGLPKEIDSICPECGKVIKAVLYPEGGKVWIKKTCNEHGEFEDIFYGDEELYYRCEELWFGDSRGVENPQIPNATKCPLQCGLCNMHLSCSALPIIDLTNRCNLSCPVCFANANATGYLYEPSYDDVVRMLDTLAAQKPVPALRVQFSGGEPTLRPDFLKIVKKAKEMGFYYVQVNTNGIRMADVEFAQAAKDAGVDTLYLQFDGVKEDVYYKTRNLPLLEYKMKTIENCRKVGISIIFVPTVVKGFNDDQVGEIVKFAAKNVDIISGIAFQPVSFVGRYSRSYRMERRYTMADLAFDIENQTGYMKARRDWYPLACTAILSRFVGKIKGTEPFTVSTHPHCSQGTFFFVDKKTKETKPLGEFIDMDRFLKKVAELYKRTGQKAFDLVSNIDNWNELQECFKGDRAPSDMTFFDLLKTLDGYENTGLRRTNEKGKNHGYPHFFAAGMHFMDSYNFSVERVMRCVIHYVDPKGRLYPFCVYNGGPTYRKRVETRFKLPDDKVKKKIIEENYPKELSRLSKKLGI